MGNVALTGLSHFSAALLLLSLSACVHDHPVAPARPTAVPPPVVAPATPAPVEPAAASPSNSPPTATAENSAGEPNQPAVEAPAPTPIAPTPKSNGAAQQAPPAKQAPPLHAPAKAQAAPIRSTASDAAPSPAAPSPAAPSPAAPSPAAPSAAAPSAEPPAPAASLDLNGLEQRLRDTHAIGLFTKLSLKNQVDGLLQQFRVFHQGQVPPTRGQLRQGYELLLMKLISLLQGGDPALAKDVLSSREPLWNLLIDPKKFSTL